LKTVESSLAAICSDIRNAHAQTVLPEFLVHRQARGQGSDRPVQGQYIQSVDQCAGQLSTKSTDINGVPAPAEGNPNATVSVSGQSADPSVNTDTSAALDWAAIASTPFAQTNRFTVLSTTEDDERGNTCDQPYTTVRPRRQGRRRRRTSESRAQTVDQSRQTAQPTQQRRVLRLLGKSTAGGSTILAAGKLRSKIVLCVDNINVRCSVKDMEHFIVNELRMTVNSCFEVKPRRRRSDGDGDGVLNRTAFRVCIFEDELDKFLNADAWPESVIISEWYFKAQSSDKRPRIGNSPSESAGPTINAAQSAVGLVLPECSSLQGQDQAATDNRVCGDSDQDRTILVNQEEEFMDHAALDNENNDNNNGDI